MGRIAAVVLLVCSAACATASPTPVSLTRMMQLQLREQAGTYPDSWLIDGDTHAPQLAALIAWSERHGIVVTHASLKARHLLGSAQPGYGGWVVLLSQDISPDAQLRTLVHELGHVYGPKVSTENEREVIAELVSAMVCQRLGPHGWP